jgi:hypothetical protein
MSTFNISPVSVAACVASLIGKEVGLHILCNEANNGPEHFEAFTSACRELIAANNGLPVRSSLSALQTAKAPGASTLYVYVCGMRKAFKRPEVVASGNFLAYVKAYKNGTLNADGSIGKPAAKGAAKGASEAADTSADRVSVSRTFTPDDCLKALQAFHDAGALTPAHYAALSAMQPAPLALVA